MWTKHLLTKHLLTKHLLTKKLSTKKYLAKIHNICFSEKRASTKIHNMCFFEKGSSVKIHKICFSENRSDEISTKCARHVGQRKIAGFCIHIVLQGSGAREIRAFPTTKMSCFDKTSGFFQRARFSVNHILCASTFFRVYETREHTFLSATKNVHKIPKCGHVVLGRRKFVGFCEKCILQGSAFHEIW